MKKQRMIYALAVALFFALGTRGILFAQEEQPKPHDAAPSAQEPEAKPETQEAPKAEKQENPNAEKQDKNATKEEKKEQKEEKKNEKANSQSAKPESRPAAAESSGVQGGQPGGSGGHIPDDKFRAHFGRSHTFVINKPVIVNNQTTFVTGGYSFVLVDAWPVGWAYTDQCYIDYINGEYFLFDLLHPGVQVALFVSI
jgi:hypothetical protein